MQTLNVFYRIAVNLKLIYLLDLAALSRTFLSSMCLEEVLAVLAVFNNI